MTTATATPPGVASAPAAGSIWARFGFGVGVSASIAANVAHSYVPPDDIPAGVAWSPAAGAIVAAAFWPLALVICVEVIQRVRWPLGRLWKLTRWGGMTAVAGIAAVISYRHMSGLMAAYGEDRLSSGIGPLAVDGLMVVCSAALLAISDSAKRQAAAPAPPVAATPPVASGNDTATAAGDSATAARQPRPSRAPAARVNDLARQSDTRHRGVEMAEQGATAEEIRDSLGVSLRSAQRYVAATRERSA